MASPDKEVVLLRIDFDVRAEPERLAARGLRRVTSRIEHVLREALVQRGRLSNPAAHG